MADVLMDAHELAIAALNEVAQSGSHRRKTSASDKVASTRNGAGIDMFDIMTSNKIVDNPAVAQEPSPSLLPTDEIMPEADRPAEDQNKAAPGQQSTSSNNSQSTLDGHDVASTPPTSTSDGFSSQSTNQDSQISQLSQLSQLAATQQPLTDTTATRPNPATAGQKRTADGQVKPGSAGSPTSSHALGHSRSTSTVSNVSSAASSRIGEVRHGKSSRQPVTNKAQLSSELRTRLSYAMVKVNNGWQSNTIDEVESLASQKGSPASSTSTLHGRLNLLTSPRTAIANLQGQTNSMPATQAPIADFDLYSRSDQPSRTYESFWRDHSTTSYPSQRHSSHAQVTSPPSKSLAPPADIRPTPTSRRSDAPKFGKPPTIPGQRSNSPYLNAAPRTPHRTDFRDGTSIQTPTQKTIQEQDAIETLLFMSSPGNSGNMGHTFPPPRTQGSPQQSPLRAEFNVHARGAQGRRVEFEAPPPSRSTESSETGGAEYRSKMRSKAVGRDRARGEAIDRLLDEMGDSSSDEDDIVLNYSSSRRVAAGRV